MLKRRIPSNRRSSPLGPGLPSTLRNVAPVAFAMVLMIIGYVWHLPGTRHPQDYHDYSYQALNYSDIISLYLRDNLAHQPRPYLDYKLEYPALLGGLSYVLSFAPSLPAYFTLTYAMLAVCALGTIVALEYLPQASPWYFAAAPALLLYTGLNWDLTAIFMSVLALLAYHRRFDVLGTLALIAAVWLKLFPLAFLGAILVERLRERNWRSIFTIAALFLLGSLIINLPLAYANPENWGYFFTFNTERAADSGIWVLLPNLPTTAVNQLCLIALILGGLALALVALRAGQPVLLPLGAAFLLWGLFVNKVFSPQYALWVFLGLALLRPAWTLWISFAAEDIGYYCVSFLILFSLRLNNDLLIGWENHYLRTPLEVLREALLLIFIASGILQFSKIKPSDGGTSTPSSQSDH